MSLTGALLRISRLSPCSLHTVLVDRYKWRQHEAAPLTSFLLSALRYAPEHRATAAQCLQHAWLRSPSAAPGGLPPAPGRPAPLRQPLGSPPR